ncbi:hypothetical protein EDC01DRAFT_632609 [Geopyxis carbonaria]|nr:hypothetical protein EDC01DRAFT_632609 [Geopyxis carbonaria]
MTNWIFQIFAAAGFVVFLSETECEVPAMALLLIVIVLLYKNPNALEQPQQEPESNIAVRTPKENWHQFDEVDAIFKNTMDLMDVGDDLGQPEAASADGTSQIPTVGHSDVANV